MKNKLLHHGRVAMTIVKYILSLCIGLISILFEHRKKQLLITNNFIKISDYRGNAPW